MIFFRKLWCPHGQEGGGVIFFDFVRTDPNFVIV